MPTTVQPFTITPVSKWTKCRSCYSPELTEVIDIGSQYVSTYLNTRNALTNLPIVPIALDQCRHCTLVQQRYTAPNDFMFSRHYWYKSGTTQTMRDALNDVVQSAVEKLGTMNRTKKPLKVGDIVLDIGSNDGTLLRSYDLTGLVRVGIEPAINMKGPGSEGVDLFINDFWNATSYFKWIDKYLQNLGIHYTRDNKAKIITAIGMFYDLDNPNQFIHDISCALHRDGIFVAQLMCLKQMLEKGDVGNLAHEHIEFYTLLSLHQLFTRHGLEIFDIEENTINGGSYRIYARHRNNNRTIQKSDELGYQRFSNALRKENGLTTTAPFDQFNKQIEDNKNLCVNYIKYEAERGRRTFVYGASTKGNVILQYYGLGNNLIQFAAEKDSSKFGKYTVGSNIPIISEHSARMMHPHNFLVLPYAFIDEFIDKEKNNTWRTRGGRFIVPLPKFQII